MQRFRSVLLSYNSVVLPLTRVLMTYESFVKGKLQRMTLKARVTLLTLIFFKYENENFQFRAIEFFLMAYCLKMRLTSSCHRSIDTNKRNRFSCSRSMGFNMIWNLLGLVGYVIRGSIVFLFWHTRHARRI